MDNFSDELFDLADPEKFQEPLELDNYDDQLVLNFYRIMFLIRRSEEEIANLYEAKDTKTPIHLAIGQEAIATGISCELDPQDKVYSCHRGHAHYLALGSSLKGLFAEILGKESGVCGGMGGSMHLFDPLSGFQGSVPIVGATIPIAVGAAIACGKDNKGAVAVCYFGDGACEEGVLHESLNLASTMQLPIIFVCENNLYSSHMDIDLRQPSNRMSRFADAHRIEAKAVDGNDVVAISNLSKYAIKRARTNKSPFFIEAITYRWRGHVGPNIDLDVGVRRSQSELLTWMKRDPIERLKVAILQRKQSLLKNMIEIEQKVNADIEEAVSFARSSDLPKAKDLMDFLYS